MVLNIFLLVIKLGGGEMQEIKCPKCGEVFVVDESGYANIVKQVRDKEFAKELQKREEELKDAQQKDLDLVRLEQKNQLDKALSAKDSELSEKDKKIQELEACIKNNDISRNLAVSEARQLKDRELAEKNTEIIRLKDQLSNKVFCAKVIMKKMVFGQS